MVRDTTSTMSCGPLMYGSVRQCVRAGNVRHSGGGHSVGHQVHDPLPLVYGSVRQRGRSRKFSQ